MPNNLLGNQDASVALPVLAGNLLLAAVLSLILSVAYVRFGRALSNRRRFAQNFLLLAVTTTLIISIVKSSVALSLGLVGALSIVRFRAAIKEPEELVFLFLAISVGLGLGAGQTLVTLVAFGIILGIITVQHLFRRKTIASNLFLTISGPASANLAPTQIEKVLRDYGVAGLQRYDATPETVEAAFRVVFPDTARLEQCQQRLRELGEGIRVSYVAERELGD
jgi:hypothetical protein